MLAPSLLNINQGQQVYFLSPASCPARFLQSQKEKGRAVGKVLTTCLMLSTANYSALNWSLTKYSSFREIKLHFIYIASNHNNSCLNALYIARPYDFLWTSLCALFLVPQLPPPFKKDATKAPAHVACKSEKDRQRKWELLDIYVSLLVCKPASFLWAREFCVDCVCTVFSNLTVHRRLTDSIKDEHSYLDPTHWFVKSNFKAFGWALLHNLGALQVLE